MDGVLVAEENGVSGYQMGYSNGSSINGADNTISVDPGTGFYNLQNEEQPNSGISFMNNNFVLSEYSNDNAAALASIFTVGTYNYAHENTPAEGVQLDYSENNILWNSDLLAQPSSSLFEVTESIASTNQQGENQREVKGTFNCKIFNEGGASRIISNGQFYLIFTAP